MHIFYRIGGQVPFLYGQEQIHIKTRSQFRNIWSRRYLPDDRPGHLSIDGAEIHQRFRGFHRDASVCQPTASSALDASTKNEWLASLRFCAGSIDCLRPIGSEDQKLDEMFATYSCSRDDEKTPPVCTRLRVHAMPMNRRPTSSCRYRNSYP
jgi:hypothetical protein